MSEDKSEYKKKIKGIIEIINAISILNQSCSTTGTYPIQLLLDEINIILGDELDE